MSNLHSRRHIPLPCRYFHTAQGCPYGSSCKFDHYSNNPSYFNYIKQKLHQISKPLKSNLNHKNTINIMINAMQQTITQIISTQFDSLHKEINSLKSIINQQNTLTKNSNNNNKHISDSLLTKHFNKITKLLKKNDKKMHKTPLSKMNDNELNEIFNKIKKQCKELKSDKKTFETQVNKLQSPRNGRKRTNSTKRKKNDSISRSLSPFDNITRYDNLFGVETEITPKTAPVTMDQIVALPIPPKTKPNIKRETNVIAATLDNVEVAVRNTKTIKNTHKSDIKTKKKKYTKKKTVKGHNNKKHHRKKQQQFRSKNKRNHKNNNKENMKSRVRRENREKLPVLSYIHDMDWYQIIKSDSSEDDTNMTSEDVEKLDMLDSI